MGTIYRVIAIIALQNNLGEIKDKFLFVLLRHTHRLGRLHSRFFGGDAIVINIFGSIFQSIKSKARSMLRPPTLSAPSKWDIGDEKALEAARRYHYRLLSHFSTLFILTNYLWRDTSIVPG